MAPKIKRNTVIREKDRWFYGRVIKTLPDGTVLWICCGLHFHVSRTEDLIADGYKGRWDSGYLCDQKPKFAHMTTLRKLKQRATRYHGRNVWNTPLDYRYIERNDNGQ